MSDSFDFKSPELSENEWWADWREADFSWEGLARLRPDGHPHHPWTGFSVEPNGAICPTRDSSEKSRLASLQDFWLSNEDFRLMREEDLIREGHLTRHFGKLFHIAHLPIEKNENDSIIKFSLWGKIEEIIRTKMNLCDYSRISVPNVDGSYDNTDGRLQLSGCVLRELPKCDCPLHFHAWNTYFYEPASWSEQELGPDTEIRKSFFRRGARLFFFAEGKVILSGSIFLDRLDIGGSETGDWLLANYIKVYGDLDAQSIHVAAADFRGSRIRGFVWLQGLDCRGDLEFLHARVQEELTLENASIGGDSIFAYSEFADWVDLGGAQFSGAVDFRNIKCQGEFRATRHSVGFGQFSYTRFEGKAIFTNSIFLDRVDLSNAKFKVPIDYTVEGAEFHRPVVWPWQQFHRISAFARARINGGIVMRSLGEARDRARFQKRILQDAIKRGDHALLALEEASRSLKNAFAKDGDFSREQQFYRFELIARRKISSTLRSEKISSKFFQLFSDYGMSIWRPIAALLVLTAISFLLFAAISPLIGDGIYDGITIGLGLPVHDSISAAAELALTNMLGPITYWASDNQPYFSNGVGERDFIFRLIIGLLSAAQQILSLVCIFFFALAIRRRYQLN